MNQKTANHVETLREKNRGLDLQIRAEEQRPLPDSLLIKSLKTEKYDNRTEIAYLTGEFATTTAAPSGTMEDFLAIDGGMVTGAQFDAFQLAVAHEDSMNNMPPPSGQPLPEQMSAAA